METTIHLAQTRSEDLGQGLMNQGLAFYNAGSRCIAGINLTPTKINAPMVPAVVCFAFAAELFLKLLVKIATGQAVRGHELADLLAAVPEESRSEMARHYSSSDVTKLQADVASISSAFVEWRYVYERGAIAINPQVVANVARAAYLVCRAKAPQIRVFGENALG